MSRTVYKYSKEACKHNGRLAIVDGSVVCADCGVKLVWVQASQILKTITVYEAFK